MEATDEAWKVLVPLQDQKRKLYVLSAYDSKGGTASLNDSVSQKCMIGNIATSAGIKEHSGI